MESVLEGEIISILLVQHIDIDSLTSGVAGVESHVMSVKISSLFLHHLACATSSMVMDRRSNGKLSDMVRIYSTYVVLNIESHGQRP